MKKRIVLGEGFVYYFFVGSKCKTIEASDQFGHFKNVKHIAGKKVRLIAEIIESTNPGGRK